MTLSRFDFSTWNVVTQRMSKSFFLEFLCDMENFRVGDCHGDNNNIDRSE